MSWFKQLLDVLFHRGPNPYDAVKSLEEKASKHPDLHWKTSIVDLMKLVDQDSSLQARERLAQELGYKGKPGTGEAAMNDFLHAKVLERLGVQVVHQHLEAAGINPAAPHLGKGGG